MSFVTILVMGVALAMDASAVSLASTASGQVNGLRSDIRLAYHFGLFQGLMPILGWYVGSTIEPIIADFDHWVASALLVFIAVNMIRAGIDRSPAWQIGDPSRGRSLVMLSIATSIDALAVGLSLKMLDVSIWIPSLMIGIVTMTMCLIATQLGVRIGSWLDKQAQIVGGVALILIASHIVISHTTGS